MLEDAFVVQRVSADRVIEKWYESIGEVKDVDLRAKLYIRLAEMEAGLKNGGNPVVQLTGFLAWVYVLPHIPKTCPAMG
jgi:hypothetical protein